ncbi:MAG: AmmeMemoRadiSam system protein B [Armatimonadetes bacterium]|nr:AmmeMemoRadiSam system protein B [Armatimonadota bacterium]
MERPVARPLEPVPIQYGGSTMIALRDPSGLSERIIMLQPAAYTLLQFMDGSNTREEILEKFQAWSGVILRRNLLDDLLEQLEANLVLDSPQARLALDRRVHRPAAHAGAAYPADRRELRLFLDGLLALRKNQTPATTGMSLVATVAPHIDLQRGASCYSVAYNELIAHAIPQRTFVVLGISHALSRSPFILTRKSFQTPLGPVPTDQEFVGELADACEFDVFLDEYNHFGEHSVEFQAVLLRHVYPDAALKIVPVLCGSFHRPLLEGGSPRDIPGVASFLAALRGALQKRPGEAFVLASVDLAHVGERFGGSALSEEQLGELAAKDRDSLLRAVEGDAEGFFATLQADRGERNYCGTSAIYTMLEVLGNPRGQLHRYDQCNEPGNASCVTVAAAGYYSPP